jgi:hypothetical protein
MRNLPFIRVKILAIGKDSLRGLRQSPDPGRKSMSRPNVPVWPFTIQNVSIKRQKIILFKNSFLKNMLKKYRD